MIYTDEQLLWIDTQSYNENARKYLMTTNNKGKLVTRVIFARSLKEAKILAREYVARFMSPSVRLELVQVYE